MKLERRTLNLTDPILPLLAHTTTTTITRYTTTVFNRCACISPMLPAVVITVSYPRNTFVRSVDRESCHSVFTVLRTCVPCRLSMSTFGIFSWSEWLRPIWSSSFSALGHTLSFFHPSFHPFTLHPFILFIKRAAFDNKESSLDLRTTYTWAY